MLVFVHKSVVQLLSEDAQTALRAVRFLEYVAMAHREGKHIISGAPDTLAAIARAPNLGASTSGSFRSMAARAAESNGLRRVLPFYVEVGHGNEFLNAVETTPQRRVLRVDVDWFDDSAVVQAAVLLAENGRDAEVYLELARLLVLKNRWNVRIQLEPRGAGGSNLAREFGAALRAKRPCLCIADSDKGCPGCKLGSTARAVRKVDATSGIHHAVVISARELENLIPLDILALAMESAGVSPYRLLDRLHADAALFVDLKNGMRAGEVASYAPGTPAATFWARVDALARKGLPNYGDCSNSPTCTALACKCVLIPPLGESVLDKVLEILRRSLRTLLATMNFERGSLEQVCLDIVAFGCASAAARA